MKRSSGAWFRAFVEQSIEEGMYEDVEVYVEDVDLAIEEGVATVYPIDYTNAQGSVTIELALTKEEAGWLITGMVFE